MLSRRVFLVSAFAVPGLSLLQRTAAGETSDPSRILVISENTCPDTSAFALHLPSRCIEADPGSILLELDRSFREGEYDLVFGLTRDSNYILIEQYAQASAYQLRYHGTHRYNASGLSHTLLASNEVVRNVLNLINNDAGDWARVITNIPVLSDYRDRKMVSEVLNTEHNCPKQSPGQLVSWLFKREQT